MNAALETLFYPFETGDLPWPDGVGNTLFINAQYHSAMERLCAGSHTLQQGFKPYAAQLEARGFVCAQAMDFDAQRYDLVLICLPKNVQEALYWIACGLRALKEGGLLVCAAENKAGGTRIQKMLQGLGLNDLSSASKHKARAVWVRKGGADAGAVEAALRVGAVQTVLDGTYLSQPGIFGWDKEDKGSALLLQHLPDDLKGTGADFGCGYGYLSAHVVQHCPGVKALYAIDADWRAVEAAKQNCGVQGVWADLTQTQGVPKGLDFIVMNPPFHEGKKSDSDIGVAFIHSAHQCLKPRGALWIVANNQLPYEDVLQQKFSDVRKVHEGQGFKVFKAPK